MSKEQEASKSTSKIIGKNNSKQTVEIVAHDDGSVDLIRADGKVKHRKGQAEDHYNSQLNSFYSTGPVRNEPGFLEKEYENELAKYMQLKQKGTVNKQELGLFNVANKQMRAQLVYTARNYYYNRQYTKSLSVCEQIKELSQMFTVNDKDFDEIEKIKHKCESYLSPSQLTSA